jgi:hypothetical protein
MEKYPTQPNEEHPKCHSIKTTTGSSHPVKTVHQASKRASDLHIHTPSTTEDGHSHHPMVDGRRKKVWKACERCRMKKTKVAIPNFSAAAIERATYTPNSATETSRVRGVRKMLSYVQLKSGKRPSTSKYHEGKLNCLPIYFHPESSHRATAGMPKFWKIHNSR